MTATLPTVATVTTLAAVLERYPNLRANGGGVACCICDRALVVRIVSEEVASITVDADGFLVEESRKELTECQSFTVCDCADGFLYGDVEPVRDA